MGRMMRSLSFKMKRRPPSRRVATIPAAAAAARRRALAARRLAAGHARRLAALGDLARVVAALTSIRTQDDAPLPPPARPRPSASRGGMRPRRPSSIPRIEAPRRRQRLRRQRLRLRLRLRRRQRRRPARRAPDAPPAAPPPAAAVALAAAPPPSFAQAYAAAADTAALERMKRATARGEKFSANVGLHDFVAAVHVMATALGLQLDAAQTEQLFHAVSSGGAAVNFEDFVEAHSTRYYLKELAGRAERTGPHGAEQRGLEA